MSKQYSSSTKVVIDNIPELVELAEEIAASYRAKTFRVNVEGNKAHIFVEFPGKRSAFKFETLLTTFGKFILDRMEG